MTHAEKSPTTQPAVLSLGLGTPFRVRWVQRTDKADILRSRSFSTRGERDAFRGVLSRDTNVLHVEIEHVPGADYLADAEPRFKVIYDESDRAGRLRRMVRALFPSLENRGNFNA